MLAAAVPLPPSAIPAPSLANVKLTEETTVAVTATVPVADVALADVGVRPMAATTDDAMSSLRIVLIWHAPDRSLLDSLGCVSVLVAPVCRPESRNETNEPV
jgi:hypothetical protein